MAFKNSYPYEEVPYWNPFRIFCGLWNTALILLALACLILWLCDITVVMPVFERWQILLISLTPLVSLVAWFGMVPYGGD